VTIADSLAYEIESHTVEESVRGALRMERCPFVITSSLIWEILVNMNRARSRVSRLGYALVAILWLFATSPLNADEMRYEGRTFEDWEADLQAHSPAVRTKAVEALAHFGPRAVSTLIKTYRSDPDEMVQGLALGALTEIEPQTSDTIRVILEAATTDPTSTAGTIATMTIVEDEKFRSRIGPDTVPAFVEAMRDAKRRGPAIQLFANRLARLGPAAKQAVPTLRELADHDPNPQVRDYANGLLKLIATGVSFAAAGNYWAGTSPMSVAIGDFNGDGKQDLVVANFTSNNWKQMRSDDLNKAPSKKLGYAHGDVSVLLGNGNGSFQVAVNYGAGTNPVSVAVGDFNGDSKQDLAVANFNSNNVSVLLSNGNGSFQAAVNYGAGTNPKSVAVGDFNGDGKQDLAVVNRNSNNVSILLGNGKGFVQGEGNDEGGAGSDADTGGVWYVDG